VDHEVRVVHRLAQSSEQLEDVRVVVEQGALVDWEGCSVRCVQTTKVKSKES
jgi:hypothetical protein